MQAGLLFGLLVKLGGELLLGASAKSLLDEPASIAASVSAEALGLHV